MTIEMRTEYLGLELDGPVVISACPLTGNIESLLRLREAGASAAVLPSLFEEQIEYDEMELARLFDYGSLSSPETSGYFPELDTYNTGSGSYLELIADAKRRLDMPIVASLNGSTLGGWVRYAELVEQAGADALELNIYQVSIDPTVDAAAVEAGYCCLVEQVKRRLRIPVSVKLGPYFSSLPHFAARLVEAGADGLVLFNRFLSPDIDLDGLVYKAALELSRAEELRVALRWIAILRDQVPISLSAGGGIHVAADAIKAILAGANVVAIASCLLQRGPQAVHDIRQGIADWLVEHQYHSIAQMRGSMSFRNCSNPEGLQRANYMRALTSFTATLPAR